MKTVALIILMVLTAACGLRERNYVTQEGAARIAAAKTLTDKWAESNKVCDEAGMPPGTNRHRKCVKAYRQHEIAEMRKRVRRLENEVATQQGLCINRKSFEIEPCQEI